LTFYLQAEVTRMRRAVIQLSLSASSLEEFRDNM
jgi:hypothetical protein